MAIKQPMRYYSAFVERSVKQAIFAAKDE